MIGSMVQGFTFYAVEICVRNNFFFLTAICLNKFDLDKSNFLFTLFLSAVIFSQYRISSDYTYILADDLYIIVGCGPSSHR